MNNFNYDLHITSINETEPDTTFDSFITYHDIYELQNLLDIINDELIHRLISLDDDEQVRQYFIDKYYNELFDIYTTLYLDV